VFAAVRPGSAATLPSAGLWLNASKSESVPGRGDLPARRYADANRPRPHPRRTPPVTRPSDSVISPRAGTNPLQTTGTFRPGRVSSRVALLLRAAERQPASARFSPGIERNSDRIRTECCGNFVGIGPSPGPVRSRGTRSSTNVETNSDRPPTDDPDREAEGPRTAVVTRFDCGPVFRRAGRSVARIPCSSVAVPSDAGHVTWGRGGSRPTSPARVVLSPGGHSNVVGFLPTSPVSDVVAPLPGPPSFPPPRARAVFGVGRRGEQGSSGGAVGGWSGEGRRRRRDRDREGFADGRDEIPGERGGGGCPPGRGVTAPRGALMMVRPRRLEPWQGGISSATSPVEVALFATSLSETAMKISLICISYVYSLRRWTAGLNIIVFNSCYQLDSLVQETHPFPLINSVDGYLARLSVPHFRSTNQWTCRADP
jgi:hypothetical protein